MSRVKNVTVIGGGVAGVCISRMLASRGLSVNLLERSSMLCAGSTWHAAGLVTRFAGNSKLKKVHLRSLEILNELHDKYDIGLHITGSIRVVTKGDEVRIKELHQHLSMASLYDDPKYPTSILSPSQCKELHPLIDESEIECGLYTPQDGDIDPTLLTTEMARLAKENGAVFHLNTEVTDIKQGYGHDKKGFLVSALDHTAQQTVDFESDILINAAGLWSKNITKIMNTNMKIKDDQNEKLHLTHPAFIIEHQYTISEAIPEIAERSDRLPCLRHLESSSYLRQEGHGILTGPYESECRVKSKADSRGDWSFGPPKDWDLNELFPDNIPAIEDNLLTAMKLIPRLGDVGIKTCVNGPTIWTGDSLARCGRTMVPNYYDFNTLTYGIAQAPALSEYLSAIILDGEQSFEAAGSFDPLRYGRWANDDYVTSAIQDTYAKNNAPAFPHENRKAGREHVAEYQSPLHEKLIHFGAQTTFSLSGVESPAWFEGPDACYSFTNEKVTNECTYDHHEWEPFALAEAKHVAEHVGIQHASFSKIQITGKDARDYLMWATTGIIPKNVGDCRLTYALTPKGKVFAEFSVTKTNENEFYLVGSRDYADIDTAWLKVDVPRLIEDAKEGLNKNVVVDTLSCNVLDENRDVKVNNISDEIDILHVAGPDSVLLLTDLHPEIPNIPFLKMRKIKLGDVSVNVTRVSFTGLVGFEFHCQRKYVASIYDQIVSLPKAKELKLKNFGGYALNSLRIEKGYKVRPDLDYVHYSEAGISPFVSMKKKMKFLGFDHLSSVEPQKMAATFFVDTKEGYQWSVPGDTPIKQRNTNKIVGYITSASLGGITGKTVALGYLDNEFFEKDVDLFVQAYGQRWNVTLLKEPPLKLTR